MTIWERALATQIAAAIADLQSPSAHGQTVDNVCARLRTTLELFNETQERLNILDNNHCGCVESCLDATGGR